MTDKVQISADKLQELISDSLYLSSLEEYGVDNWSGYDMAQYPEDGEIHALFASLTNGQEEGLSNEATVSKPKLLQVVMKDPDSLYDAIQDYLNDDEELLAMDDEEAEAIKELRADKISDAVGEYFKWGEYATLEFDITDLKNIKTRVVPENEQA